MDARMEEFALRLKKLNLDVSQEALAILWYLDREEPGVNVPAGRIARFMHECGLGNPNATRLRETLRKSKYVHIQKDGLRLKPAYREDIEEVVRPILGPQQPKMDHEKGFIPRPIWCDTRRYIEITAEQVNGAVKCAYFDAAAVMLRRLVETLLIETYEHLKREHEIRGTDGNYLMLGAIVSHATGSTGLNLGRETKSALESLKKIGDWSAHNRRYSTKQADLEKIHAGARLAVEELVHMAGLK